MTSYGLCGHYMLVALCDIVAQNTHKINKSKKFLNLNYISSISLGPYLLFKIYVIQPLGISLRKKMLRPSPLFPYSLHPVAEGSLGDTQAGRHRQTNCILKSEWICCGTGHFYPLAMERVPGSRFESCHLTNNIFPTILYWVPAAGWVCHEPSVWS